MIFTLAELRKYSGKFRTVFEGICLSPCSVMCVIIHCTMRARFAIVRTWWTRCPGPEAEEDACSHDEDTLLSCNVDGASAVGGGGCTTNYSVSLMRRRWAARWRQAKLGDPVTIAGGWERRTSKVINCNFRLIAQVTKSSQRMKSINLLNCDDGCGAIWPDL